jgi:hypothetical protein
MPITVNCRPALPFIQDPANIQLQLLQHCGAPVAAGGGWGAACAGAHQLPRRQLGAVQPRVQRQHAAGRASPTFNTLQTAPAPALHHSSARTKGNVSTAAIGAACCWGPGGHLIAGEPLPKSISTREISTAHQQHLQKQLPRTVKAHAAAVCRPDLLAMAAQLSFPATPHTELQPGTPGKPLAGGACVVGYRASAAAATSRPCMCCEAAVGGQAQRGALAHTPASSGAANSMLDIQVLCPGQGCL